VTASAFAAVLFAAGLHAAWNAMLKGGTGDRLWTMTIMSLAVALVGAAAIPFLAWPAAASWPYIVASGLLHVGYNLFLVQTYGSGDFSETYPIARGSSPMLVALGAAVFAGEWPDWLAMLGIGLVGGGIISLAFKGKGLRVTSLPAAIATGAFIGAYSVVDGIGVRAAGDTLAYAVWMSVLEGGPMLVVFVLLRGGPRAGMAAFLARSAWRFAGAMLGGWVSLIAYGIVIWAMHYGPMGPVSALRETSVLFAILIGRLLLKEQLSARCVASCIVIACGAACLGVAR
jgi:drug/metabolite transporter (DMT)-like permease